MIKFLEIIFFSNMLKFENVLPPFGKSVKKNWNTSNRKTRKISKPKENSRRNCYITE
jgi:hypothetical protein